MKIKKDILFFAFLLCSLYANGQRVSSFYGVGVNIGRKMPSGSVGININYIPRIRSRLLEFNIGAGSMGTYCYGFGTKIKFFKIKEKYNLHLACNYSRSMFGVIRLSDKDDNGYYYKVSDGAYLHYYVSHRLWIGKEREFAINIYTGYRQTIDKVTIEHSNISPDIYYDDAHKFSKSGLLLGIDFIVFLGKGEW